MTIFRSKRDGKLYQLSETRLHGNDFQRRPYLWHKMINHADADWKSVPQYKQNDFVAEFEL
jgi:hypothetical protein